MHDFTRCRCGHFHGSRLECQECLDMHQICRYTVPLYEAPPVKPSRFDEAVTLWILAVCAVGFLAVAILQMAGIIG